MHEQNWPDNRYVVAGRQFILPRLQTWHADPGIRYSYSNNLLQTRPWTPLLSELRAKVEASLQYRFNSIYTATVTIMSAGTRTMNQNWVDSLLSRH